MVDCANFALATTKEEAMRMPKTIEADKLRSALDYDPDTGVFTWKTRQKRNKTWNTKFAGKVAGSLDNRGYWVIRLDDDDGSPQLYQSHRLAWVWVHGAWPRDGIDHINGIQTDNRIANLRLATQRQNLRNCGPQSNNKVGLKGVSFCKHTGRWRAQLRHNGKSINIGRFDSPEEANAAYRKAEQIVGGEFCRGATP